jgi:hypothetical protein
MNRTILEYFRCPDDQATLETNGQLSAQPGFFKFGRDVVCYGQCANTLPLQQFTEAMPDVMPRTDGNGNSLQLPFDLSEVVDNLRLERYHANSERLLQRITGGNATRKFYYLVRPVLPVRVRKYLQKAHLSGWDKIMFPRWPVDFTVETLMEKAMVLMLKSRKLEKVPFIWFWPDGAPSSAIMTHDVESTIGRDVCGDLMNIDDSFGIKSAFQIVPETRYDTRENLLESFRRRGFEVNVHDLNHDGLLFKKKDEFLRRAAYINEYTKKFGSQGFRSGAMYRNQAWFDAFDFSYDMSVPNVAHLEPQQGGCCTVMPYFIGKILELPLTTIQDYSLFHILGDYSIDLWTRQIDLILQRNGLISFICHPDYLIESRAQSVYRELLGHLARLRAEKRLWIALPRDVDRWWRSRNQMKLVPQGKGWKIEGPECQRARVAYARLSGDRLVYTVEGGC